jgi:hypothetical protein
MFRESCANSEVCLLSDSLLLCTSTELDVIYMDIAIPGADQLLLTLKVSDHRGHEISQLYY